MVSYGTNQMHAQVDKIKNWSDNTLVSYALLGMLLGACGGYGVVVGTGGKADDLGLPVAVGTLIGGLVGSLAGYGYSFIIRRVMHTMLCLARIEQNISGLRCDLRQASRTTNGALADEGTGSLLLKR
jgi:hypothetical protein